jgi:hypothetical protein
MVAGAGLDHEPAGPSPALNSGARIPPGTMLTDASALRLVLTELDIGDVAIRCIYILSPRGRACFVRRGGCRC